MTGNGYDSSAYGATRNGGGAEYQDPGYGHGDSGSARGGYGTASYGQSGYEPPGDAAQNGGGSGAADYNQSGYGSSYATEFMPADADADDAPAGRPRPIGRLSIYTLIDDKAAEFDRIAERAAEGVRSSEPDTLVYVIHVVPKAPMQRIIYEIYRDRAAFEIHERQPHIQRFMADRASCVLATNIIDLRLKYAKVAALGAGQAVGAPGAPGAARRSQGAGAEAQREPRTVASAAGRDQYRTEQFSGGQYDGGQYDGGQYDGGQYDGGQYDGGQYDGGQYGSTQYRSAQYDGGQYAGDQPAAATSQYPAAAATAASFTRSLMTVTPRRPGPVSTPPTEPVSTARTARASTMPTAPASTPLAPLSTPRTALLSTPRTAPASMRRTAPGSTPQAAGTGSMAIPTAGTT